MSQFGPTSTASPVLLSSRGFIDHRSAGLFSAQGAEKVISTIASRRSVTKLLLGHNHLGDHGVVALFQYLSTPEGKQHPISEISLNSNGIGTGGLLAISKYLSDNTTLKELFLQHNAFTPDPDVVRTFAESINASCLSALYLSTNPDLSDAFVAHFLPNLTSTHLRELHLSAINLSADSGPIIADFVASQNCCLRVLKLNGNLLGIPAVKKIISAIKRDNFILSVVEMHSNNGKCDAEEKECSDNDTDIPDNSLDRWKAVDFAIRSVLQRNRVLKESTAKDALSLLRHSRPVLLRSISPTSSQSSPKLPPADPPHSAAHAKTRTPSSSSVLPPELVFYILSFLGPCLSSSQIIRVFEYASSPDTLPSLELPSLVGSKTSPKSRSKAAMWDIKCVPDPTALPFGGDPGGGCAGGKCMGNSVVCRKEKERSKFLEAVGCSEYERS